MSWGRGQRLDGDRYEILERIGTGGFGVTYKAIDRRVYCGTKANRSAS